MTRLCSGCGLKWCEGRCLSEEPAPADEETISTLTLADLRKMYGNPLRNGELGLTETVERELKFTMELQRRRA